MARRGDQKIERARAAHAWLLTPAQFHAMLTIGELPDDEESHD